MCYEAIEKNVLFKYHNQMGHLGVEKIANAILQNYWFSNLTAKVKQYIAHYLKCIAYLPISGKPEGVLHSIPKENIPLDTLHIDLGPLAMFNQKVCLPSRRHVF